MMNRDRGNAPEELLPDEEQRPDGAAESTMGFEEMYELYANDVLRMSYYYLGDRQRA